MNIINKTKHSVPVSLLSAGDAFSHEDRVYVRTHGNTGVYKESLSGDKDKVPCFCLSTCHTHFFHRNLWVEQVNVDVVVRHRLDTHESTYNV